MNKKNISLIVILSLIVIISSIFIFKQTGVTGEVVKESGNDYFMLAHGKWVLTAPVFVAQEKGFFNDFGLDVEYKYFASGRDDLQALLGGSADIATVAEPPLVFGGFNNLQVDILATFVKIPTHEKIAARKDKGINSVQDLKGKKIATLFGTRGEYFTKKFLEYNNISLEEVELINLKAPEMVTALVRGDVDAVGVWEPNLNQLKKELKDNYIEFEDADIPMTFSFVTRKDYTDKNQDKLIRFLKAIKKANEYIVSNKEESILIVSKYTYFDEEFLRDTWNDYTFELYLDESVINYMNIQAQWAIDSEIVAEQEIPDYNYMIYDGLIKQI